MEKEVIDEILFVSFKEKQVGTFDTHVEALKKFNKEDLKDTLDFISKKIESSKYLLVRNKMDSEIFDRKMDRYFWIYNNIASVVGKEQFAMIPTSKDVLI